MGHDIGPDNDPDMCRYAGRDMDRQPARCPCAAAGDEASREPHAVGKLRLSLLAGFELRDQGRVVAVALASQRLVAFLGLHERPLLRSYVGGTLWPDTAEARASSCLRSAMWRTPSPGGVPIFTATASHIVLDQRIRVDYRDAVRCASNLVGSSIEAPDRPDWSDLGLFDDELLPGWCDEWILVERESFRQLRLHALERLCERLAAERRYERRTGRSRSRRCRSAPGERPSPGDCGARARGQCRRSASPVSPIRRPAGRRAPAQSLSGDAVAGRTVALSDEGAGSADAMGRHRPGRCTRAAVGGAQHPVAAALISPR